MSIEAMKLALEALEKWDARGRLRVMDTLRQAIEQAQEKTSWTLEDVKKSWKSGYEAGIEQAQPSHSDIKQEPMAKPYAYEYGRDNGDGTYSVVIDKGDLVQTAPAVYNYVRPRNTHKDWPVKELFDHAPPQRQPLTDEELSRIYEKHHDQYGGAINSAENGWAYERAIIRAADGITGEHK